jgi:MtfA peptidase
MMGWWKRRRRKKLRQQPFNPAWREAIAANFEIFTCLEPAEQEQLLDHVKVLLGEKHFEACGGLELTDEIKVIIAAQAGLLLMHRETEYFSRLKSILVYPSSYFGQTLDDESDENAHRLGESWDTGVVILAWDSVLGGAHNRTDGQNLVFHEFCHQLDQEDGLADGLPILADGDDTVLERHEKYTTWSQVLSHHYKVFVERTERGHRTVLDSYGATNPAEYFAVATECFFEKSRSMKQNLPQLYEVLHQYYRLDPVQWHGQRKPARFSEEE